ncbi:MAG TPA: hypothetical protein VMB84_13580, partial [Stellaceae bacterium]|nr:hypothetical protein [Stellaceae bacterium]
GLVLALAGAALLADAAERRRVAGRMAAQTAAILLPAALLYAVWRYYVAIAGVAELVPLPFAQWNWALLPATFAGIGGAIAEKPVFFGAVALALLLLGLLLRRRGWSPATRALAFFAATFVLYNLFLIVTYIAHFSPLMSAEAHSYFRYNTHLSLILVLALALAARELAAPLWASRRVVGWGAAGALGVALVAPLAFAERLRFDIEMPQPLVWDLAAELKPYLQDGDRLALVLPGDDGEIGRMLADYLASAPPRRRGLALVQRRTADAATLAGLAATGWGLALISCTPPGLAGLVPGEAALLKLEGGEWRRLAAWPHPAGIALSHWQRTRHWPALCR